MSNIIETENTNKTDRSKLSIKEKASYGLGGFVDQIMANSFSQLAFPIYNIALKMDATLLGTALAVPRFVDTITDPLMGHVSDNTRSKWGRRKPFIFAGSFLMSLALVLVFSPPQDISENALFYYVAAMGTFLYLAYTIFSVPYNALGYELTSDYNERTSVQAWRMVMMSAKALIAPWLLKLCFWAGSFFPDANIEPEVIGVFYITLGLGVLVIIGTIPLLLYCQESSPNIVNKPKSSFWKSFKFTLGNDAFRIHLITIFMVMIGNFLYTPLNVYLNNYYIYGGDKDAAATMVGYGGTIMAIFGFLAIPLITFVSKKLGKKPTYCGGLILCGLLYPTSWFLYTPDMPYLQLLLPVLVTPALTCCWVLNPSITADICDYDEWKNGTRREGMFSAVWGFAFKLGISLISLISGVIITWTGFLPEASIQSPETIFRLRILIVVLPFLFLTGGGLLFLFRFPLSRDQVEKIQKEL